MIPVSFLSTCVVELILASNADDVVNTFSGHSNDFSLQDLRLYGDYVSVHDSYLSALSSFLLQPSNRLTMHFQPYSTIQYSITARDQMLTMPKAMTRLMNYVLTFGKTNVSASGIAGKPVVDFYMSPQQSLRYFAQLGSERMPELDMQGDSSMEEMYMRTMQALGVASSSAHSCAITPAKYKDDTFFYIEDLEALPTAHASGKSTMNSSLIVHLFGLGTAPADLPTHAYILTQHDAYISISSGGVELAE